MFTSGLLSHAALAGQREAARCRYSIVSSDMARIDLYVKVELDTDELEPPDRLAEEICRIVSRIYGVRRAEVSNMVEKET
jgi:hypothetical protein